MGVDHKNGRLELFIAFHYHPVLPHGILRDVPPVIYETELCVCSVLFYVSLLTWLEAYLLPLKDSFLFVIDFVYKFSIVISLISGLMLIFYVLTFDSICFSYSSFLSGILDL